MMTLQKKRVVETTRESHEKNSITATELNDPGMSCSRFENEIPGVRLEYFNGRLQAILFFYTP